jgi:hypothetical protein
MKKSLQILFAMSMFLLLINGISALTVTRAYPTSTSSDFQMTYQASNLPSTTWAILIHDYVTGGCKFPDGTNEYRAYFTSADGSNNQKVTVTVPSSGTCIFTTFGVYGDGANLINFPSQSITINSNSGNTNPSTSFDFNQQIDIGGFKIVLWQLLAGVIAVIVLIIVLKK